RIRVLKPSIDTRYSKQIVKSAAGPQISATDILSPIDNILSLDWRGTTHALVDEIQFFTIIQIEQLRALSISNGIEVICYGLLKDFRCNIFDSSRRLLELCDTVRRSTSYCMMCRKNGEISCHATVSMKIMKNGDKIKAMVEGNSICIGGIETYIPVCYKCYYTETGPMQDEL
ncbi:thymidine kinase, partial [Pancytospora epiphaga]